MKNSVEVKEKRWFTVIFSGPSLDSYGMRAAHYKYIKGLNLEDALKHSKIDSTSVWFAFEGAQNPVTDWKI